MCLEDIVSYNLLLERRAQNHDSVLWVSVQVT